MDDFRQMINFDELTSDDTITLARAAAEAIRGLNHATRHETGLGQPSVAYDVLGALSLAAARIGQALAQITRYLDRALAAGRLGHDRGQDPAHAVEATAVFLSDAAASAAALAGDLDAAQQQLAPSTAAPPGPAGRTSDDRPHAAALRVHRHAVHRRHPRPGPVRLRRAQRSRRPAPLAHLRPRAGSHHR